MNRRVNPPLILSVLRKPLDITVNSGHGQSNARVSSRRALREGRTRREAEAQSHGPLGGGGRVVEQAKKEVYVQITVQAGDNLSAIAQRLGTTVEELQRLNGI